MNKGVIAFIVVAAIAVACIIFNAMKKSADDARAKQEDILREFKTIDESLKKTNGSIDTANDKLFKELKEKTGN
jgi:hypothetical protein